MRFIAGIRLASFVALTGAPGIAAGDAWDGFTARMGDYDLTLALSQQFATILAEDDRKGLGKLADTLRNEASARELALIEHGVGLASDPNISDADHFEQLVVEVSNLDIFDNEQATRAALGNLGTCEWAGIHLRSLVFQVAEGGKSHRIDNGRIVIDNTSSDRFYALQFARCQLVRRQDREPPAIGYHKAACTVGRELQCPKITDR